jgi:hypothetical protein
MADSSEVPWNVFSPNVYTSFCSTINGGHKSKGLTQIVDSRGNATPAKEAGTEKRDIFARTLPPNLDTYSGYTFQLDWSGGDGSCPSNCSNVFSAMAESPCGHTAGEQNIMASQTELDTGCGIYSYKTSPPAPQLKLKCNTGSNYKKFSRGTAKDTINGICNKLHTNAVVLSQSGNSLPPSSLDDIFRKSGKDIAESGATLVIDSNWPLTGCGDESNPQDVNFGSMSVDECVGTFLVAMDSCGDFTNPNGDKF